MNFAGENTGISPSGTGFGNGVIEWHKKWAMKERIDKLDFTKIKTLVQQSTLPKKWK